MRKKIILSLLMLAAVLVGNAANGIIETKHYTACEGDFLSFDDGETKIMRDTVLYDTIAVADPAEDSIYVTVVNFYPSFLLQETRDLVPGNAFLWHGMTVTKSGVYNISYKTVNGCDSTYTLIVEQPIVVTEEQHEICRGDSYFWHGNNYSEEGEYMDIVKTKDGKRDSIYHRLQLKVKYIPLTRITKNICQGGSYTFGERTLTEAGVYTEKYIVNGCDSVVELSLNVLSPDTVVELHQIAEGESYEWQGQRYAEAGVYDKLFTNRFGCDSIMRLVLTTHHVDVVDTTVVICPSEEITWHGITARETHEYSTVETLADGSQVLYRLHLTVKPIVEKEQQLSICDGETVSFNGEVYAEAGTYYSRLACDTIYKVVVTKSSSQLFVTNATFDGSTPYTWVYTHNGRQERETIRTAGTYNRYFENAQGCKDTYRLILSQDQTDYYFEEALTVCEGDDFSWRGRTNLSKQGIGTTTDYYDRYTTAAGKDSVYHLALTVNPILSSSRTISFCEQTYFKGQRYTESAVVYDTISSVQYGCDSIVKIFLDKSPQYLFHDTATIVQGELLSWFDLQISTDGLYRRSFVTVNGCDSIYELGVGVVAAVPQTNVITTKLSVCDGDVYEWRNKKYTVSGTYTDTLKAATPLEKDSIFVLNLTVHPSYPDTIVQHLYSCGDNGTIRYNGTEYTEDATVITNYKTVNNCDSIVKVFLHFNTAKFTTDTMRIADNDTTRFWHEQKINHAGTYLYETKDPNSDCYSREQLVVIMYQTFLYQKDTVICQTEAPYHWYDGPQDKLDVVYSHTPGETKTYEYRYQSVNGVDSIYRLNLSIYPMYESRQRISLCEGDRQFINGKLYYNLRTDSIYRDTIINRSKNNCDSIVYLEIYQYPVKRSTETRILHEGETIDWNGQTITKAGTYEVTVKQDANSCDSISQLIVVGEFAQSATICVLDTPYIWREKNYYTSGIWNDTVRTDEGYILEYHSLDLTVNTPVDTTVYLHACKSTGVTFHDVNYMEDTDQDFTLNCDTIFHMHIKIDQVHDITIVDTICERDLPYILGRQFIDTIWSAGTYTHTDETVMECDSIINLRLFVIPSMTKSDSMIVCERELKEHPIYLGDTINPWFETKEGGKYSGQWQGKWHGVPIQQDTIVWDCDSTYYFHLIVKPQEYKDSVYYLCEGDSVQFGWPTPKWIKSEGFYYDTLPSHTAFTDRVHGYKYEPNDFYCDSITRLEVRLRHPQFKDTTAFIPQGDSIWWGGAYRFYTGDYDSIGHAADMDSNEEYCKLQYTLHLSVQPTYYFRDTIELCYDPARSITHEWATGYKQTINLPNQDKMLHYVDSLLTVPYRFDSIYDLYVKFNAVSRTYLSQNLCQGDSLRFGLTRSNLPRYLTKSGVYTDTLVSNLNGCDSIIELKLNVFPRYITHQTVHIADVDTPYVWEHKYMQAGAEVQLGSEELRASGEYSYKFPSAFACDSIDSLSLRIHKTYLFRDTVTICQSETPYTWLDKQDIYLTDTYTKHYQTVDGYDSIYMRTVVVLPLSYDTLYQSICEGDSLRFGLSKSNRPRFLYKAGTYNDTLTATNGCDSIVTLRLNVFPRHITHQTIHIADVDTPYVWEHSYMQSGSEVMLGSEQLRASGEYSYKFPSAFACDSIDSLSLRIHKTYLFRDTVTICQSETPYTWLDKQDIYVSDTYTKHYQTVDGYDSIYVRVVNVLPVKRDTLTRFICESSLPYYFNGKTIERDGTYTDSLTSWQGCDSIVTLVLNVNKPYFSNIREDIYEGQSYMFYGTELTESGTYTHHATTPAGCDSTTVLQLVVHRMVDEVVTICQKELPYRWTNKWNGQVTMLYEQGLYRNDTTIVDGERMFYGLQLNVLTPTETVVNQTICEGSVYNFKGQLLREQGEYRDTLVNAAGCDSIVVLNLSVLNKYHNVVTREIFYGDTVHFLGETYSESGRYPFRYTSSYGCDSIIELNLIVRQLYDDSVSICNNSLPFVWHGRSIYESGIYRDTTTTNLGETKIESIKVNVLQFVRNENPITKTICEGDYYRFGSKNLTAQGVYYDTLVAKNGCDSIVTLVLQVQTRDFHSESRTIFEGDSVLFHGEWKRESGVYDYAEDASQGCGTSHQLVLTVLPIAHKDTMATICQTDLPFIWHGVEYNQSGDYNVPTAWTDSLRVITTLHLTVYPTYFMERSVSICQGSSFVYNGVSYSTNSTIFDTIPTVNGCDSVIKINISVNPIYEVYDTAHISDKETYQFGNQLLRQPGIYHEVFKTQNTQCDSIVHLVLQVHPTFYSYDETELCQGDTIRWHNKVITTSGLYSDSLRTVGFGYDSIYQFKVTVHPNYLIERQYEITKGTQTYLNGIDISQPGVYYDSLLTVHGCDSIYKIVVNWSRILVQNQTAEICQGDYYDFYGRQLTRAGEYVYYTPDGTAEIHLQLSVRSNSIVEERIVIAPEDLPYIYGGHIYEAGGIYADTMLNVNRCDSINRLVLVVSEHYSDWEQMALCPGAEIKIEGETITEAGLYTYLKRSKISGLLDSLYRVEVFDAPAYESKIDTVTICEGDTVEFADKKLWRAGDYSVTYKTMFGCDSIVNLYLKVNPVYSFPTYATITDYQTYEWKDKVYDKSGTYTQTYPTKSSCDSVFVLYLTVLETNYIDAEETICEGDRYNWRGQILSEAGIYNDTLVNIATSTSEIYSLRLNVTKPTIVSVTAVDEISADAESFRINFSYEGTRPYSYSILFDDLAHNEGFADIINADFSSDKQIEVPMPQRGGVIYNEHSNYVRPNNYTLRLLLDNGVCDASKSDSISLIIRYPNWIIEQNWDNVVAPLSAEFNGGYEFGAYSWYINDVQFDMGGKPYLYTSTLKQGDKVVLYATRVGESYAIPTMPLIITAPAPDVFSTPVLVYPKAVNKMRAVVTLEAETKGTYKVYSTTGKLFSTGRFTKGEQQIEIPQVSGCSFISCTTDEGETITEKVVVY